MSVRANGVTRGPRIDFDVWGCRGSRSFVPARSDVGNHTSCYSVLAGDHLLVLDGGRGLGALAFAMKREARFRRVRRLSLLIGHSHLDHWEGLKDTDWFWQKNGELRLAIFAPEQALAAIRKGYGHPAYVALEVLANGHLTSFRLAELRAGRALSLRGWRVATFPLNHFSGSGKTRRPLDAFGFRLSRRNGPTIAYLCDHQPTEGTRAVEDRALRRAQLAVVDAHFPTIRDHAFGHGSVEAAAALAERYPELLVLGSHHGPNFADQDMGEVYARFRPRLSNLHAAREGATYTWRPRDRRFQRGEGARPSPRTR